MKHVWLTLVLLVLCGIMACKTVVATRTPVSLTGMARFVAINNQVCITNRTGVHCVTLCSNCPLPSVTNVTWLTYDIPASTNGIKLFTSTDSKTWSLLFSGRCGTNGGTGHYLDIRTNDGQRFYCVLTGN